MSLVGETTESATAPATAHRSLGSAPEDELRGFDYAPQTRVIFAPGCLERLPEVVRGLGGTRLLLVTDPGLLAAGHVERCVALLRSADLFVQVYHDVQPNPTTDDVDRGLDVARTAAVNCLVALGGGSSMDCAKGINFLLAGGGRMQDYWGTGKARGQMLPLVAIPTTAGTGSEAQSYALIADAVTHVKMACGDRQAAPRVALLDPQLTLSSPASVTCVTGLDAITHAVESFVSTRRNPVSQLFSVRAWRLLASGFPGVMADPASLPARSEMLLGAHFAGAAIENAMLGAAHALANPLTARYGITHGLAVSLMLPHVVRFNEPAAAPLYAQLVDAIGLPVPAETSATSVLADQLRQWAVLSGAPQTLSGWNIPPTALATLASDAAEQWTRQFNPRPVDQTHLLELYQCAWD